MTVIFFSTPVPYLRQASSVCSQSSVVVSNARSGRFARLSDSSFPALHSDVSSIHAFSSRGCFPLRTRARFVATLNVDDAHFQPVSACHVSPWRASSKVNQKSPWLPSLRPLPAQCFSLIKMLHVCAPAI